MLRLILAQSSASACNQGPGRNKPWFLVCGLVRLLDVKKKPLPRINGERKKERLSGAGPSGKWERGYVSEYLICIDCLAPFKPMMITRLFNLSIVSFQYPQTDRNHVSARIIRALWLIHEKPQRPNVFAVGTVFKL